MKKKSKLFVVVQQNDNKMEIGEVVHFRTKEIKGQNFILWGEYHDTVLTINYDLLDSDLSGVWLRKASGYKYNDDNSFKVLYLSFSPEKVLDYYSLAIEKIKNAINRRCKEETEQFVLNTKHF